MLGRNAPLSVPIRREIEVRVWKYRNVPLAGPRVGNQTSATIVYPMEEGSPS